MAYKHARATLKVILPRGHEAQQAEREHNRLRAEMERRERSNLYRAIMDIGGISLSSDDVRQYTARCLRATEAVRMVWAGMSSRNIWRPITRSSGSQMKIRCCNTS